MKRNYKQDITNETTMGETDEAADAAAGAGDEKGTIKR
jgi:hypothetical protein